MSLRTRATVVALLAAVATPAGTAAASPTPARPATSASVAVLPVTISTVSVRVGDRSFNARLAQPTGSAPGAYPVIAFGHGFLQGSGRYDSTVRALAARGYVVVAPDSETGFFPNHGRFADDLWGAVTWARSTQPNASPTLDAVSGHSMGGGAALLAADRHPELETVATLAAAETNPSATTASAGITAPALFVVGSVDGVVAPSTTRRMYDAKPAPARWASITGGYHCGFADSTSYFGLGCDSGTISRATQLSVSQNLLGGWFDQQLKGAPAAPVPSGVVTEQK
ncbi:alpha/beta hydrolase [Luteipulveratus sp. YIM 133132]|uniref:alpha/beta hydrolase n=1 Tax=Luteipulveratus flavus TaxID=3031728 RepID=UPI0023AF6660|nr:alpha/beta hydrolase [Luteipulveratus sp. YIM 133132]MDE9367918.1 alpha/beta hydrolase [Luteipulveratus sp. YIM 133132]